MIRMSLEKKYISKENWKRIVEKKSLYKQFKYNDLEGEIALLELKEVKAPLYKQYNGVNVKLADNGYYWLQVGIKNKNYWLTAMYDINKKLIQYYIDITKENKIYTNGKSYFYDLFLDIVQLSDGSVLLLDKDELVDALNNKLIDENDYALACGEADKIIEQLEKNNFEPIKICKLYLEELLSDIKNKDNNYIL